MSGPAPLELAVAGCGQVFERYHLPALRRSRDWRVVAVSDPDRGRLARALDALPGAAGFERAPDMLASVLPDAVLVATPPAAHAAITLAALERGCHVLVEKPMALRAGEARRMLEGARSTGKLLAVGFNRRFRRMEAAMARRIREALPGSLHGLHHELLTDARWQRGAAPPGDSDRGSVLDDVACHGLDLLAWSTGRRIAAVRALPWREGPDPGGAGALAVEIELRLAAGQDGEMSARSISGWAQRHRERLEASIADRRFIGLPGGIMGRRGGLAGRLAEARLGARHAVRLLAGRLAGVPSPSQESFGAQLAAFAAAVRAGGEGYVGATALDGLRAVLAVEACRASLEKGGSWERLPTEPEPIPCA